MDIRVDNQLMSEPTIRLGCVGYETRSIYGLTRERERTAGVCVYFDYRSNTLFSYDKNRIVAEKHVDYLESDFDEFLRRFLSVLSSDRSHVVEIDITSLDRSKIASLLGLIFENSIRISQVRLIYFPSKFAEPKNGFDVVNSFGPVLPKFMGNSAYEREELTLIVGAGFEYGRIVGAIDTLEPKRVHCFTPIGMDPRFDEAVKRSNLDFSFLDDDDSLIEYDLNDTYSLYYNLRRIVEIENVPNNVMILPLGPKIFAAISIITALVLHPNVMVWRHSTANILRPETLKDVDASGAIIDFTFSFDLDAT